MKTVTKEGGKGLIPPVVLWGRWKASHEAMAASQQVEQVGLDSASHS